MHGIDADKQDSGEDYQHEDAVQVLDYRETNNASIASWYIRYYEIYSKNDKTVDKDAHGRRHLMQRVDIGYNCGYIADHDNEHVKQQNNPPRCGFYFKGPEQPQIQEFIYYSLHL